ncbi:MAG: hypothetical protein KDA22_07050 [Phycisphaerales bacterium]|nr:hypothetical protein [Phycisphaerales bacterium]
MQRLLSIALFLGLGTATTVAIAVGCAARAPSSLPLRMVEVELTDAAYQRFASGVKDGDPLLIEGDGTCWLRLPTGERGRLAALGCSVPPSTTLEVHTARARGVERRTSTCVYPSQGCLVDISLVCEEVRAGWPFRALNGCRVHPARSQFEQYDTPDASDPVVHGLVTVGGEQRDIPFMPLPLGFAANACVFALCWWTVLLAPQRIRSAVRARRFRCARCGYPIGSSPVCTECGTRLAPRRCIGP